MSKFVRILIIINGLIIPALVIAGLFQLISKNQNKKKHQSEGIIIGEKFDEAVEQNLALQGLEYDSPRKIYNSNIFYMPVSIMTYKEAMDMKVAIASSNNYGYSLMKLSNVLFLDSTFSKTHWLLDKKASIKDLSIREPYNYNDDEELDTNYRYLSFEIGFEDSNNDGLLNSLDLHDLYISDLNGENLTQVTEKIDVVNYNFQKSYSSIFIQYTERNDSISEEHKLVKFAKYQIEAQTFIEYKSLNNTIQDYHSKLNSK